MLSYFFVDLYLFRWLAAAIRHIALFCVSIHLNAMHQERSGIAAMFIPAIPINKTGRSAKDDARIVCVFNEP